MRFSTPFIIPTIRIIGLIFFGFGVFYSIKQYIHGKPIVILTKEGFYDFSSAIATKDRLIPWTEVTDIGIFTIAGQNFLSIALKNREKFLSSLNMITRKATQANLKLGAHEINITMQNAKSISLEELAEQMLCFLNSAE